jgi:hypothetical protein
MKIKYLLFMAVLALLTKTASAQLNKALQGKWQTKTTHIHFNPRYAEAGLQYELGKKIGLRLGADLVYGNLVKTKARKDKTAKTKTITKFTATNLQITRSSNLTFLLEADNMRRKTKPNGFTSQFGYGLGLQRTQYTGTREPGTISGRTYLMANLNAGIGYTLKGKLAGSSVLFSVRKNYLWNTAFKLGGSNTQFEISFVTPILFLYN